MSNIKWFIGLLLIIMAFWLGKQLYFQPKYINGEKAPAFDAVLIDGSSFSLSELKGKYVLLDFWGSWCGPCRVENPELVALWEKYSGVHFRDASGFVIVSIGMETDAARWKRAIQRDGLRWKYHISDLKQMDSEIGILYGVREVPTKYLINPDGHIMGVNQTAAEIGSILAGRMKN